MDLGSKIFSSILCTRLFVIIRKYWVKYQFGSTTGVGCQDGSFTIKTMLHLQHNHNLPTFVMFADLVKAFDTSNHKHMVEILAKYGCPPKLRSAIFRMYVDSKVRLCKLVPQIEGDAAKLPDGNSFRLLCFIIKTIVTFPFCLFTFLLQFGDNQKGRRWVG